jgi:hypothetical protein
MEPDGLIIFAFEAVLFIGLLFILRFVYTKLFVGVSGKQVRQLKQVEINERKVESDIVKIDNSLSRSMFESGIVFCRNCDAALPAGESYCFACKKSMI